MPKQQMQGVDFRLRPNSFTFEHPEPAKNRFPIWPVFIPHAGCTQRCIFCSQEKQSGTSIGPLKNIYDRLEAEFEQRITRNKPPIDLGFFGGTFTAIPFEWQHKFIAMAGRLQNMGFVRTIRCSTRPDSISPPQLEILKNLGLNMIELGIQSWNDKVLDVSRRGYCASTARNACRTVVESGLVLGVQLMAGLPEQSSQVFQNDIKQTVAVAPQTVRLYPCLVLKETGLADMFHNASYLPWNLEQAEKQLGAAVLKLWKSNIQVIRIGLTPEESLLNAVIAGPWHPSLGTQVRSRALYLHIKSLFNEKSLRHFESDCKLFVPLKFSGEFWGHAKATAKLYQPLGIVPDKTSYWDKKIFKLTRSSYESDQPGN